MAYVPKSRLSRVTQLMKLTQGACTCPAHMGGRIISKHLPTCKSNKMATQVPMEYAFEMASSNIRYGENATR
ncbi:hypothetical protein AX774_g4746 [Zancudomyces culisetae]|uniref:Uncharacterized protein n=1 Tax=Zancudomyces culisetae TaxID=1213189 RepID=A0A1R1PLI1_ZANCU|nr:hypothetical protein AX774_g4746 [Zancudomyces culisetae]|eukprot:OMH81797.1 hypothetical protein AX774_g4746 [Zancudomyces culisetae]